MAIHDGKVARAMTQDFTEDERYPNTSENGGTIESPKLDKLYRLVGIVFIVSVIAGLILWLKPLSSNSPAVHNNSGSYAEPKATSSPKQKIDWASKEKASINQQAKHQFQKTLADLKSLTETNVKNVGELEAELKSLSSSEAGAKIATSEEHLGQLIALKEEFESSSFSNEESFEFLSSMNSLLREVEQSGDEEYAPQEFTIKRANSLIANARERGRDLLEIQESIDSIMLATKDNQPTVLLVEAIKQYSEKQAEELAVRLAKARNEAAEAEAKKLEAAEREKEKAIAQMQLVQKQKEADQIRNQAIEAEAARKRQQFETEFQRDLADINNYLAPFLAEGRRMRGGSDGSGPVSYSYIVNRGGLEDNLQGMDRLVMAASDSGRKLSGFPDIVTYRTRGTGVPHIERAQELLRKYGELLVEKGMLAK